MDINSTSLRAKRCAKGFSLAEVLVAMFVLVVGISGVTATIWWGSQKADSGKIIQEASAIGRVLMETMATSQAIFVNAPPAPPAWFGPNSGLFDDPAVRREIVDPPFDGTVLQTGHIQNTILNTQSDIDRFRRNIRVERDPQGANTYGDDLCGVTVRVYWQDKKTDLNPTHREHHVTHELVLPHRRNL